MTKVITYDNIKNLIIKTDTNIPPNVKLEELEDKNSPFFKGNYMLNPESYDSNYCLAFSYFTALYSNNTYGLIIRNPVTSIINNDVMFTDDGNDNYKTVLDAKKPLEISNTRIKVNNKDFNINSNLENCIIYLVLSNNYYVDLNNPSNDDNIYGVALASDTEKNIILESSEHMFDNLTSEKIKENLININLKCYEDSFYITSDNYNNRKVLWLHKVVIII